MTPTGSNQLRVAEVTYVAITGGFVYVAVILDAWSRRVVGYAIARSIDLRLTLAALHSAITEPSPPPSFVHHGDRGSQYAAGAYRQALADHGLIELMERRGNPYDNAKAESFIKTLKVQAIYPVACETCQDVAADLPPLYRGSIQRNPPALGARLPQPAPVRGATRPAHGQNRSLTLSASRDALHQGSMSRACLRYENRCRKGRSARYAIEIIALLGNFGGDGGIRTLGTLLGVRSFSKRVPSASRPRLQNALAPLRGLCTRIAALTARDGEGSYLNFSLGGAPTRR